MRLNAIIHKVHAEKIHILDKLSGEQVIIDPLEPSSMRTIQRFLHLDVESIEPAGQDVKIILTIKVKGG